MMDGLVSTRKFLSLHNIKNNFSDIKNFSKKFYSHFKFACGKGLCIFEAVKDKNECMIEPSILCDQQTILTS